MNPRDLIDAAVLGLGVDVGQYRLFPSRPFGRSRGHVFGTECDGFDVEEQSERLADVQLQFVSLPLSLDHFVGGDKRLGS